MRITENRIVPALTCLVLLGTPHISSADEGLGIAVKAGTLGVGAELSSLLLPKTRLRASVNYLNYEFESTISDIVYEFEPEHNSASLVLDVHPFGDVFFISDEAYFNNNTVEVNGTIDRGIIPANYYRYAFLAYLVSISGDVEFNPIAPYARIGWCTSSDTSGWGFAVELGVLYQGAPDDKSLRENAPIDVNGIDEVQRFLAEQEQEIEDELDWFKFYPVVSAMLT